MASRQRGSSQQSGTTAKAPALHGPWQNGPTELIEFAITHLHGEGDFEHRVAFLLLDVGVETLFKTYLTLPEKVTGTTLAFGKRRAAAEGNFHELVAGIEEATKHLKLSVNLADVEFYHDIRNKLYHQGNGITVPTEKAHTYAQIAVNLLRELLDVDLTSHLKRPEIEREARHQAEEQAAREAREVAGMVKKIGEARQRVADASYAAMERYCMPLVLPSFQRQLDQLWDSIWKQFSHEQRDAFGNVEIHLSNNQAIPIFNQRLTKLLAGSLPSGSQFLQGLPSSYNALTEPEKLYVAILQTDVDFPEELGEIPDFNWLGIFQLSNKYPEISQGGHMEITGIDEDGNQMAEYVSLSHAQLIQSGQDYADKLSALSDLLNRWTASQQSS